MPTLFVFTVDCSRLSRRPPHGGFHHLDFCTMATTSNKRQLSETPKRTSEGAAEKVNVIGLKRPSRPTDRRTERSVDSVKMTAPFGDANERQLVKYRCFLYSSALPRIQRATEAESMSSVLPSSIVSYDRVDRVVAVDPFIKREHICRGAISNLIRCWPFGRLFGRGLLCFLFTGNSTISSLKSFCQCVCYLLHGHLQLKCNCHD